MALTKIDFEELRQSKTDDSYKAFCRPQARDDDRQRIAAQIEEFEKRGGKVHECTPAHNVSAPTNNRALSQQEQRVLERTIKSLCKEHGNTCNIRWDLSTDKFRAFFRGYEVGSGFSLVVKASEAIRNEAQRAKH